MIRQSVMRKRLRALTRSEAGTSMVEFAVLAPVFIFLLIGLIEIGRFTFFALLAANAARAGAQYGAQTTFTAVDTPGITTAVLTDGQAVPGQNLANWTTAPGSITANCYYTTSTGGPPSGWQLCSTISAPPPTGTTYTYYVQVNVTGTFTSLLKYPGIPQQVPVSGSATMRVASQ